jgi:hypothetical protein
MDQKIKHFVWIRFKYAADDKMLPIRTRYLNEICLESLRRQTNKNFQIVISGCADAPVELQLSSIKKLRDYHGDDEFIITTRIDSDDIALPNFIAEIQNNFVPQTKIVLDPYGYAYDVRIDKLAQYNSPHTSAFLSFIDYGKNAQYCNAYPHPQMGQHFTVRHIKKYCRIFCINSNSMLSSQRRPGSFTSGLEINKSPYLDYITKLKELDIELKKAAD